jgi:hypothetical protein
MAAVSSLWFLFLLSFLAMPLPVGLPPLPPDPALLRVAPADTLAYFQWFGTAVPDPQSPNHTEALLAEPEVQRMLGGVVAAVRSSVQQQAGGNEIVGELADLGLLAMQRPGCVFLGGLELPPTPLSIEAGLVVHLGEDAQKAQLTMRKMESLMVASLPPGLAIETDDPETEGDVRFRALPLPPGSPRFSWAVVDGYLALAVGEKTPAGIVRGLRGGQTGLTENQVFKELHPQVQVARPCARSFLDVAQLVKMAIRSGGEQLAAPMKVLGISDMRAILSESGLEGDGYTARTLMATSGRSGLLKLLDGPPLSAEDLAIVPGDASFANAFRVDPLALYRGFLELVDDLSPGGGIGESFKREVLGEIEETLGLRVEEDILAHLGDTLTLWNSPGQGGLLFSGLTAAFSLENPAAFQAAFAKVMAVVRQGAPPVERSPTGRLRRNVYLEQFEHRGQRVYFLNAVGEEMPFAPAWCATDTHLLVSLFPQMLKATIDRGPDLPSSLGSREGLLGQGTLALFYTDAKRLFETLYPASHPLGQLILSELQREGLDLDISLLPTYGSILPHLGLEISNFSSVEDGFLLERSGTLPLADPVLGALALPLLLTTRTAVPIGFGGPDPIALRPELAPRRVPPPVNPEQPWLVYDITSAEQVFDPEQETLPVPWPKYVTDAERREVEGLLDDVGRGGVAAIKAKTRLRELGHKSLAGIINRLRKVNYTDSVETFYAYELNKLIEGMTILINANFQPVAPGQEVDLRIAHWNAMTVKPWIRFLERYPTAEGFDRLIKSIKARRR